MSTPINTPLKTSMNAPLNTPSNTPMNTPVNTPRNLTPLRILRVVGGVIAYGCLAAFLCLIAVQLYRWFREGEWTRIGISDGLRATLVGCCVNEGDTGHLANVVHWLDTPTDWFGWHRVLEVVPASIGLFSMSMLGNFAFIYSSDRIEEQSTVTDEAAA